MMIKVVSDPAKRAEIICLAEVFDANVVDVGPERARRSRASTQPDQLAGA